MPRFGPVTRREFINALRRLGFLGPYSGTKHQFMVKGTHRVRLPNPHRSDIGRPLLRKILQEANIDLDAWERL